MTFNMFRFGYTPKTHTQKNLGVGKNPNFLVETLKKNYKKIEFLPKHNFLGCEFMTVTKYIDKNRTLK